MDSTTDLKLGQVVRSKAGRDKGRIFVVAKIVDEKNVLVVDGDIRKISCPKLKKAMHLTVYKAVINELADVLENQKKYNDAYVRKLLKPFYIESLE